MSTDITIANVVVKQLRPQVNNPKLKHLLPTKLFPESLSMDLLGVSNATSNAVRRGVTEILVSALYADYEDCHFTDREINPTMICSRLRCLPIAQSTPLDAIFTVDVTNNTPLLMNVTSKDITITKKGTQSTSTELGIVRRPLTDIPFNETFVLFTLNPGKTAQIRNIRIKQSYGHLTDDGMHVVAMNARSVALGFEHRDMYAELNRTTGAAPPPRTGTMDIRKWQVTFKTNGQMPARAIVAAACQRIQERVSTVISLLHTMRANEDTYTLIIPGENDTVGNLFMRGILDLYPGIRACTYCAPTIADRCEIRIRVAGTAGDPAPAVAIFTAAAEYITACMGAIKKQISAS